MIPDFPPNSDTSRRQALEEEKNIKRVTSSDPIRKKRPLRKQLAGDFFRGDARTATEYVVFEVLVPAARDMVSDVIRGWVDRKIYGEARRGGSTPPVSGATGYVDYRGQGRYAMNRLTAPQRAMSRQARARHDFDEIVLEQRGEAEEVIDNLFEVVSNYGAASVADLYGLVGITGSHVDNKWGWTSLQGAGVTKVRAGYLLDLPEPQPLD